jgi:DNA-directed RNA polymerase specialized sigma24 family protein
MTKEQLRNYKALTREHRRIEQRLRTMEKRPDCDQEALRPLRECYQAKLEALVNEVLAIEAAIESLTPTERELVRLRYIEGLPWFRVAMGIHYSERQTDRIHRDVLRKLKKV